MTKLNSIMPVLNSAHLWGRYKQKFSGDSLTLIHNAPLQNQIYTKYVNYRNIHWIYGTTTLDDALKQAGSAIYMIEVPKQFLNSVIDVQKEGLLCLAPWQVISFVEETQLNFPEGEGIIPLRQYRVFKFQVSDDYKNHISWQRKTLIK